MSKKNRKRKKEKQEGFETPDLNTVKARELALANQGEKETIDLELENLKIILPVEVYYKLLTYTKLIDTEITGFGLVDREGNEFRITEVFLAEQQVSGGACEITTQGMVDMLDRFHAEGKDAGKIRFWWHSHNTMSCYWSDTDTGTGKGFSGGEYVISLVINHKGEMRAKINIFKPFKISLDKVEIVIEHSIPEEEIINQCKDDIKEFVKKETSRRIVEGFNSSYPIANTKDIPPTTKSNLDLTVKQEGGGPFGAIIEDNGVRVVWNTRDRKYYGFDMKTNIGLTEQEFIHRVSINYNDAMFYSNCFPQGGHSY